VKATRGLEALLVRGLADHVLRKPWRESLRTGERLGELAFRLGIRRRVADANLRRVFPERSPAELEMILAEHYREVGRVVAEYPRLAELARAPLGEVVAEVTGLEHVEAAFAVGKGVILMTGHYGNFELMGAWMARKHPIDFVVKPLSNPAVEEMLARWRGEAGMGAIPLGSGVRRVFEALAGNRGVAMLADQDGRKDGVFVNFLGQPSSTPAGPAEIALRTGAPIVMGFISRRPDGRHGIRFLPPLEWPEAESLDRTRALTARHVACLEARIRERPEMWFWLHRRWKTPPPTGWHPTAKVVSAQCVESL
jgi:KDO2-lipid IV(A) lauroyltransferase